MRKLFAIAIALSMMSSLYALKLGIGGAYEDVAESGRYFAIKADARIPLMPIIDVRGELLNVALPDGGKAIHFGTFTGSDLLIKLPMPMAFQPYIALGVWFDMGLEDAPGDYMDLGLKGALGGEMGLGGVNLYLEAGLNKFQWVKDGDTTHPIYVQLGVTVPVAL
jgi:hypothetical protein